MMLDFTDSTTSFAGIVQTCTIAVLAGLGDFIAIVIVGNDEPCTVPLQVRKATLYTTPFGQSAGSFLPHGYGEYLQSR
jgi:hypothetical protein